MYVSNVSVICKGGWDDFSPCSVHCVWTALDICEQLKTSLTATFLCVVQRESYPINGYLLAGLEMRI